MDCGEVDQQRRVLGWVPLTVTGVGVEHLLDDEELFVPVGLTPAVGVGLRRTVRNLLQTPLTVVPDPVDLRMLLEEGGGQG